MAVLAQSESVAASASAVSGAVKDITGTYAPASLPNVKITYRSSKPGILSVDKAGRLTAKEAGKAKITVKAGNGSRVYEGTVKGGAKKKK